MPVWADFERSHCICATCGRARKHLARASGRARITAAADAHRSPPAADREHGSTALYAMDDFAGGLFTGSQSGRAGSSTRSMTTTWRSGRRCKISLGPRRHCAQFARSRRFDILRRMQAVVLRHGGVRQRAPGDRGRPRQQRAADCRSCVADARNLQGRGSQRPAEPVAPRIHAVGPAGVGEVGPRRAEYDRGATSAVHSLHLREPGFPAQHARAAALPLAVGLRVAGSSQFPGDPRLLRNADPLRRVEATQRARVGDRARPQGAPISTCSKK